MASKIIYLQNQLYRADRERERNMVGMRIAQARKKEGLSLTLLESRLKEYGVSVTRGSINKWETGETAPNAYQLLAVCHALGINDVLPYFSEQYYPLLDNRGEQKVIDYIRDLVASGLYAPPLPVENEYCSLPFADLPASAGSGQYLDYDGFDTISVVQSSVPKGADYCLPISGDSMEPVFHDKDIVFVKRCEQLSVGDVGIFVYAGEGYIKVYTESIESEHSAARFRDSSDAISPRQVLVSYNHKYDPIYINPELGFAIIGKVLGRVDAAAIAAK